MATVSDGTTNIDIGTSDERIDATIEKSTTRTAGGNYRSVTGGERLAFSVKCRLTPAVFRTLLDLLKNGASSYYFTPNDSSTISDLYPTTTFPLNCNITNLKRSWDNRSYYYVSFTVESSSYV